MLVNPLQLINHMTYFGKMKYSSFAHSMLMHIPIKINYVDIMAMVDTSATHTFITSVWQ